MMEQLVVATRFLQGCVEVFDLKKDRSYIECSPAIGEEVTDVVCDERSDSVFAFSGNRVSCFHRVRCMSVNGACSCTLMSL